MSNNEREKHCPSRGNPKKVKLLLRTLTRRLERKFSCRPDDENWNYRNAAYIFHEQTGCAFDSAILYFYMVEDYADWRAILGRTPTIKDRSMMGYYDIRLP